MGALAKDGTYRERRDELLRGARHYRAHLRAALLQAANQVEALVGSDAAADDEQDAFVRECHGRYVPGLRDRRPIIRTSLYN